MKTELQEAMTAGVFVEFHDAAGNTLGQALYTDWRGRPLPSIGDTLRCETPRLFGRVVARQFELQHEADGTPCVWVRLLVAAETPERSATPRPRAINFSQN